MHDISPKTQIACLRADIEEICRERDKAEAEAQALREELKNRTAECNGLHEMLRQEHDRTEKARGEVADARRDAERHELRANQYSEELAALRARVVVVPDWKPLTGPGQIKKGDLLRFAVAGKEIEAPAQLIINEGTGKEEIVYNRGKNHYFITSMAVAGTSSHKSVQVKSLNGKVVSEGLLRETVRSVDDIFWAIHAKPSCQSGVVARCRCSLCAGTRLAMARDDLSALLGEGKEVGDVLVRE